MFNGKNSVAAYPDIETRTITPDWEFVVIACDGIWDVMSNREVITYIRENIAAGVEPEEICETLMMRCLAPDCQMAGLGCDNMTVVIVGLLHGESYEKLVEKCQRQVELEEEEEWGKLVREEEEKVEEEKSTVEITEID